ncbi:MAG TPA: M48 family metallopeptidase [Nocardioidaceae bacterium]|nr:M48 family metallopeptidase [Nocardioidaceae bacterium]
MSSRPEDRSSPETSGSPAVSGRAPRIRPGTVAAGWLLALGAALGAAIWLLVPWTSLPTASGAVLHEAFTDAQIARADEFAAEVRPPSYLALGLGLVVVLWLTLTSRGLSLLRRTLRGPRWLHVPQLVVLVSLASWLVTLPVEIWRESVLREWGLSTQAWVPWLLDGLTGLGISTLLTSLGLMVLWWLGRRLPRWWFVPTSLGAIVLTFGLSFAYPVVIEPVFNDFEPMRPGELRTSLLELAERDGVPVDEVLVADASRRTTSLNAYVSGLGATRRIVVYDNLVAEATPEQIEVIVAHELGHADARDVLVGSTLSALGAAAGLTLLWWVLRSRWVRRRGVAGAGDPMAAAVVLGLAAATSLVILPVTNAVSRQVEARADRHALALSGAPETVAEMQQRLALTNLNDLTPPAWSYWLFASHPSAVQRIELAHEYRETQ